MATASVDLGSKVIPKQEKPGRIWAGGSQWYARDRQDPFFPAQQHRLLEQIGDGLVPEEGGVFLVRAADVVHIPVVKERPDQLLALV